MFRYCAVVDSSKLLKFKLVLFLILVFFTYINVLSVRRTIKIGFLSKKKINQIAAQGFSNLLIRQKMQIYHFQYFKGTGSLPCLFLIISYNFLSTELFKCKHSTTFEILTCLNYTKKNNKFA
jgi:hypothetical protein